MLTLDSMPISPKVPVTCECGRVITKGLLPKHREGVYHRNYKLILSMLEKDCHSFAEIGDMVGVSRERIRQTAKKLGASSGRERGMSCKINTMWAKWASREQVKFLRAKGFDVRPVMWDKKIQGVHYPSSRRFRVNGKVCIFAKCTTRGRYLEFYMRRRGLTGIDFVLVKSPVGYFVVPASKYPVRGTQFAMEPDTRRVVKTRHGKPVRHDYVSYLESWHLLKVRKHAA